MVCISPKISARARERYRLATKKSDSFDAFVLADTLRHEHTYWRPIARPFELLLELRAMIRDRERLIWQQRDVEIQLRTVMEAYNPAVLHVFSSLDRDISLAFVRAYPMPEHVARIGAARVAGFTARQQCSGRTAADVLNRPGFRPLLSLEGCSMSKQYPSEIRESAVWMVLDRLNGYPSVWAACQDIGPKLDVGPESLRKWVVQAQIDAGQRSGPTSDELHEIRRLRREVKDLNKANEILRAASIFFVEACMRMGLWRRDHAAIPSRLG